jgi:hypothetical protein
VGTQWRAREAIDVKLTLWKLLCTGMLAGLLLAAPVWSQSPLMYTYNSLNENGGYVFGYGETDLLAPADWCQAWAGFCYDEYASYVTLDLSLGSSSMGGNWAYENNAPAWTSVWSEVEVGEWQLDAHHDLEVWYREDYWEWPMYAWLTEWTTLYYTVYPQISISSGQIVYDGDGANFYVTVERGTPTSYAWSFDYPAGAGNGPSVSFSDPYAETTSTDAHWFAYPDGECSASGSAIYDITATVGFQSGSLNETTMLDVVVPWQPGGEYYAPTLTLYLYRYQSGGLWRVHSSTFLTRSNPFVSVSVPAYSQFYSKADEHEQVHVDKYGPGRLKGDLYSPTGARNAIINLTHSTEQGLIDLVHATVDSYRQDQTNIDTSRTAQAEAEAYGVSDDIAPRYIYQNCGRY